MQLIKFIVYSILTTSIALAVSYKKHFFKINKVVFRVGHGCIFYNFQKLKSHMVPEHEENAEVVDRIQLSQSEFVQLNNEIGTY